MRSESNKVRPSSSPFFLSWLKSSSHPSSFPLFPSSCGDVDEEGKRFLFGFLKMNFCMSFEDLGGNDVLNHQTSFTNLHLLALSYTLMCFDEGKSDVKLREDLRCKMVNFG